MRRTLCPEIASHGHAPQCTAPQCTAPKKEVHVPSILLPITHIPFLLDLSLENSPYPNIKEKYR
jgi:hypothetical protein